MFSALLPRQQPPEQEDRQQEQEMPGIVHGRLYRLHVHRRQQHGPANPEGSVTGFRFSRIAPLTMSSSAELIV